MARNVASKQASKKCGKQTSKQARKQANSGGPSLSLGSSLSAKLCFVSASPQWEQCDSGLRRSKDLPSLSLTWQLTQGTPKRKVIFRVPAHRCYVDWWEGRDSSARSQWLSQMLPLPCISKPGSFGQPNAGISPNPAASDRTGVKRFDKHVSCTLPSFSLSSHACPVNLMRIWLLAPTVESTVVSASQRCIWSSRKNLPEAKGASHGMPCKLPKVLARQFLPLGCC